LVLYVVKGYQSHFLLLKICGWSVILQQCGHVYFPSWHQMVMEVFANMVDKTKEKYVILSIVFCVVHVHLTFRCFMLVMINFQWFVSFIHSSCKPIHHLSDYWPFWNA
jgi:hypothetical protein